MTKAATNPTIRSRSYARNIFVTILLLAICAQDAVAAGMEVRRDSIAVVQHHDSIPGRVQQIDIIDVFKMMFNLKKNPLQKAPRRGTLGPFYTIVAFPGYAIATGVAAIASANISFRTKKNPMGELSFINNQFQYTQHNQIIVQSLSNFYTSNEKWQFPGDIRFLHFPTTTYGLGSNTLPSAADNIDYYYFRFYRTVLRKVYPDTYVGLGYNLDYRWNIEDYNLGKGTETPLQRYGYKNRSTSSGPTLNFLYDARDNPNRPLSGHYVNVQLMTYLKPLGSNSNWNALTIDIRKYVSVTNKWYAMFAFWGYAWITLSGKPPYLDLPSVGWDSYNNTGRGYGAGRFRGRNMFYFETEFRFDILRNGLLGGVVFGNLETLSDYPGRYFGDLQPGGGVGLRIKFNKHTNSNSCLDYGFGTHDSRGFATNINEVF